MNQSVFTNCIKYFFLMLVSLLMACQGTKRIKSGADTFAAGRYWQATQLLSKEFEMAKSEESKFRIAFLSAESFEHMNQPYEALQWYEQTRRIKSDDALTELRYGYALKSVGRYEEAKSQFEALGKQLDDPNRFRNEIIAIINASDWERDKLTNQFSIAIAPFNSLSADYGTTFDSLGKIYFASDRVNDHDQVYLWTGRSYAKIYKSDSSSAISKEIYSFVNQVDINTGLLTFSPDFNQLAYCKCIGEEKTDAKCKIYYSQRKGTGWTDAYPLNFIIDSLNYLSPAFDKEGQGIFFSMEDPKLNTGFDIYFSKRSGNEFMPPERLSESINTSFNEKYVSVNQDTLYFASDNNIGMGGLDIYKTYLINGKWTPPINLKAPVNSAFDDFAFVVDPFFKPTSDILEKGYFSSNRPGGLGNDDIYTFTKRNLIPKTKIDTPSIVIRGVAYKLNIYVNGFGVKNGQETQNPADLVALNQGTVQITQQDVLDTTLFTNPRGYTSATIDILNPITLYIRHEGYLKSSRYIDPAKLKTDSSKQLQELTLIINLHPILYNQEFVINNIYYDYNKYNIRPDAEPALDELVALLKLNDAFKIKIASHTDCRGTESYNQKLSSQRARSVVEYLIKNGIEANRLTSQGYGKSRPLSNCKCAECTEDQYQLDRRTTFQLIR